MDAIPSLICPWGVRGSDVRLLKSMNAFFILFLPPFLARDLTFICHHPFSALRPNYFSAGSKLVIFFYVVCSQEELDIWMMLLQVLRQTVLAILEVVGLTHEPTLQAPDPPQAREVLQHPVEIHVFHLVVHSLHIQ